MVHKVDGNPQLDSRDWSMYSNILKDTRISRTEALEIPENHQDSVIRKLGHF